MNTRCAIHLPTPPPTRLPTLATPHRRLGRLPRLSFQKITWNASTQTVIYRSKRHYNTKRNFEIFKAPDFIAAALLHLPPKGQQTVRYYGVYSNKTRGQTPLIPDRIIIRPPDSSPISNLQFQIPLPKSSSSPPRQNNLLAACVPYGATSFSKSGEPTRSNARAAKLP
jgi:hypothetical protein